MQPAISVVLDRITRFPLWPRAPAFSKVRILSAARSVARSERDQSRGRCMAAASCSFNHCWLTRKDDARACVRRDRRRDTPCFARWATTVNGREALDSNTSLMTCSTCDMSSERIGGKGSATYHADTGFFRPSHMIQLVFSGWLPMTPPTLAELSTKMTARKPTHVGHHSCFGSQWHLADASLRMPGRRDA